MQIKQWMGKMLSDDFYPKMEMAGWEIEFLLLNLTFLVFQFNTCKEGIPI